MDVLINHTSCKIISAKPVFLHFHASAVAVAAAADSESVSAFW
jgi:hypothetical protein